MLYFALFRKIGEKYREHYSETIRIIIEFNYCRKTNRISILPYLKLEFRRKNTEFRRGIQHITSWFQTIPIQIIDDCTNKGLLILVELQ